MKRENSRVKVVNAANQVGLQVDATHATGDLNIFPGDVNAPHYVLTHDLSGNAVVGVNTRNARRGDVCRVTRNSATPAAFSMTVVNGPAASGTTLGRAIAASRNGFVEAKFDGTNWICIGVSELT